MINLAGFIFEIAVVTVVVLGVPAALITRSVLKRNRAVRDASDAATARDKRWEDALSHARDALGAVVGVLEASPALRFNIPQDVQDDLFAAYSESSDLLRRKRKS